MNEKRMKNRWYKLSTTGTEDLIIKLLNLRLLDCWTFGCTEKNPLKMLLDCILSVKNIFNVIVKAENLRIIFSLILVNEIQ